MRYFLVFFLSFSLFSGFSQDQELRFNNQKSKINRFNKGVNVLSFTPAFQFNNLTGQESIIGLGAQIGYNYFLINNWSIGSNLTYSHFFISPNKNRANDISTDFVTKYYFFTNKNLSFFIGIGGGLVYLDYKTMSNNPNFIFYNDPINGEIHSHFIPLLKPQAGISFKVMKKITVQINLAYNHSFYKLKGNGKNYINPISHYCSFNYHFPSKTKTSK